MTRAPRITLAGVARRAGVSLATVSRVLSDQPHVKAATRQRVKSILAEMRYDPQALYTASVPRGIPMLGFLVPESMASLGLNRAVYLSLVHVLREEVEARGYGLYVGTFSGTSAETSVGDHIIRERQIVGAIVNRMRSETELAPLRAAGLPVVVLNRPISTPGVHAVTVDNQAAAAAAARHLIGLGHRRLGVLGGPEDVSSASERLRGYRAAVDQAGLPPDALQLMPTDLAEDEGRRATAALLDGRRPPTAILAVNDYLALAALELATSRGLRVPEDVSIVGFDDIEAARYVTPALTTVHMPWDRMARWAARLLVDVVEDDCAEQVTLRMRTELIVRASSGPAARPLRGKARAPQRAPEEVSV